jgi:hypothetical protein
MSHHHEHEGDEHESDEHEAGGKPQGGARNDTGFLDLEISKVLFDEAEGITRKAFRELLEEAAKRQFQARFGDRIEALAKLAVDELIADIEANLQVEATIAARQRDKAGLDARVQAILAGSTGRSEG